MIAGVTATRAGGLLALLVAAVPVLAGAGALALWMESRLDTYRAEVAAADQARRVLTRLAAPSADAAARADPAALLIQGMEPLVAAANAQRRLLQLIQGNGGMLASSQSLPPADVDGLTRLSVQATFDAKIADVVTILHEVESGSPLMAIGRITIVDPDGSLPPGALTTAGPNPLRVDLVVDCYWRAP